MAALISTHAHANVKHWHWWCFMKIVGNTFDMGLNNAIHSWWGSRLCLWSIACLLMRRMWMLWMAPVSSFLLYTASCMSCMAYLGWVHTHVQTLHTTISLQIAPGIFFIRFVSAHVCCLCIQKDAKRRSLGFNDLSIKQNEVGCEWVGVAEGGIVGRRRGKLHWFWFANAVVVAFSFLKRSC